VVGRDAVVAQVDAQAVVAEDAVVADGVAVTRQHVDADGVEGDRVGRRRRAADGVAAGGDADAVAAVAQVGGAVRGGADQVALDGDGRGRAADLDAVAVVAADHVAGVGDRAADGHLVGVDDVDAVLGVAQVGGAVDVGPDEVALDLVARAGAVDPDAVAGVARDDVAGAHRGAADGVGVGAAVDADAEAVGDGGGAGDVGADEVARHDVVVGGVAADLDAGAGVAADDVAVGRGRAADGVAV